MVLYATSETVLCLEDPTWLVGAQGFGVVTSGPHRVSFNTKTWSSTCHCSPLFSIAGISEVKLVFSLNEASLERKYSILHLQYSLAVWTSYRFAHYFIYYNFTYWAMESLPRLEWVWHDLWYVNGYQAGVVNLVFDVVAWGLWQEVIWPSRALLDKLSANKTLPHMGFTEVEVIWCQMGNCMI